MIKTETNTLIEEVKTEVEKHNILNRVRAEYGEPLFLTISGSHDYGFPSDNQDIDIRGVYVSPTKRFLGLKNQKPKEQFEFMSPGGYLDISLDEIGKYLELVNNSNPHRIEWANSPLVFYKSEAEEFPQLLETVNRYGLTKSLCQTYEKFSNESNKMTTKMTVIKGGLHRIRALMTGITLAETGQLTSDLPTLNERFGISLIDKIISLAPKERNLHTPYFEARFREISKPLRERLKNSIKDSALPENANTEQLNDYLLFMRSIN